MPQSTPPLSAAILAGGQSTRMGTDKAQLRLLPAGPTLIEQVCAAVRTVAAETFLVANDNRLAALGLRTVADEYPGAGPLGGIYTATLHAQHDHCLIVACDMPFLNRRLLHALAAVPRHYDVIAPWLTVGENRQGKANGVYETLHAIYGRGALPAMHAQLEQGQFRIIGFFPQVAVYSFPEATIRQIDPQLHSFFNLNTPERMRLGQQLARVAPEMR